MPKDGANVYRNVTLATRARPYNTVDGESYWTLLLTCGHEVEFRLTGRLEAFGLPDYVSCEACTDVAMVAVGLANPS
jgi:hypothetical protein